MSQPWKYEYSDVSDEWCVENERGEIIARCETVTLARRVAFLPGLIQAAREVVSHWSSGDLANAVRTLNETLLEMDQVA